MTLNQVIDRIQKIALAHKQLRNFYCGAVVEFLNDKQTRYASSFLQEMPASIDLTAKTKTFNFRMFFLDLVHVSDDTKANQLDVQSDMFSVAEDIISEIDYPAYTDWKISTTNTLTFVEEELDDMVAGVVLELSIITPFIKDVCAVPTEPIEIIPIENIDVKVYDTVYKANGTEGKIIEVPEIAGKKVLLVTRENSTMYKVSNLPGTTEYFVTANGLQFGKNMLPNERVLILYRNY